MFTRYSTFSLTEAPREAFCKAFKRYLAHYNSKTVLSPSYVHVGANSLIKDGNLEYAEYPCPPQD